MQSIFDHPPIFGVLLFLLLCAVVRVSCWWIHGRGPEDAATKEDFGIIMAAVLTLLGLIIGFTFSMAINRYDQRKSLEENEANAIGTEYIRADLLPDDEAAAVRRLLKEYTRQRILYYRAHSAREVVQVAGTAAGLQRELWSAVRRAAGAVPTPITALAVAGMNDVLNSEGYTQAAWLNRIPLQAWGLLLLIALTASVMIVYSAPSLQKRTPLLLILPAVVSISFMMIADIDSPRGGFIRVTTVNLQSVLEHMR